jgi:hypothetical protein
MNKNGDVGGVKTLAAAKNCLLVQSYYKGVKSEDVQIFDSSGNDGSEYALEFRKPFHGKGTYSINWTTGRYRFQIYDLNRSSYASSSERSGKCELIHPSNGD